MKTFAQVIGLGCALILAGCGDDSIKTTSVGELLYSSRLPGETHFTTAAERGVFRTYTSLLVPVATPVTLEQHINTSTKQVTSQTLKAMDKTADVESVVTMAE